MQLVEIDEFGVKHLPRETTGRYLRPTTIGLRPIPSACSARKNPLEPRVTERQRTSSAHRADDGPTHPPPLLLDHLQNESDVNLTILGGIISFENAAFTICDRLCQ